MKGNKVTIYDIASRLNISPGTVSRVLNNSSLIGSEKRNMVLKAAEEMGYKKRKIKKQSSRSILNIKLFLPVAKYSYIHLFYDVAELILGIQKGFNDVKVNIITRINDGDNSVFQNKKLGDIDACIFAFSTPGMELISILKDRGIPYLLLNRIDINENYIAYDSGVGMQRLFKELVKKRRNLKPCYIGFSAITVSREREQGVIEACRECGIDFSENDIFRTSQINEISTHVMKEIIDGGYNSVLCFNDVFAVYFYHEAVKRNLRIPESFSLTGFDNSPVLDLLPIRIDTIDLSISRLGFEAGNYFRKRIVDRESSGIQLKIVGTYQKGETI